MSTKETIKINSLVKLIFASAAGCFIFFVPLTINANNTILVDHICTWTKILIGNDLLLIYISCIAIIGSILAFVEKEWKKGMFSFLIVIFKLFGTVLTIVLCLEIGPPWLMAEDVGGWLIYKLLSTVTLIVPLGGTLIILLTDFGLLELIGAFIQPFMYRMFRTSGRSAICIVSSFVGSFSVGLLMTDKLYNDQKFTYKESVIVATGFSTISASFMVVIAKNLKIMEYWVLYFLASLLVTCIVSFITVRIWPIRSMPNSIYKSAEISAIGEKCNKSFGELCHQALEDAMKVANNSPTILACFRKSIGSAFRMGAVITPTVIGGAFVGITLCKYTSFFDYAGYVFYPFFKIFGIEQPLEAGKAIALSITESMVPTVAVMNAAFQTRFIIAMTCVSTVLFIAGTIPCIISTKIKVSFLKLLIIWFERAILSAVVACTVTLILFPIFKIS